MQRWRSGAHTSDRRLAGLLPPVSPSPAGAGASAARGALCSTRVFLFRGLCCRLARKGAAEAPFVYAMASHSPSSFLLLALLQTDEECAARRRPCRGASPSRPCLCAAAHHYRLVRVFGAPAAAMAARGTKNRRSEGRARRRQAATQVFPVSDCRDARAEPGAAFALVSGAVTGGF